MPDRKPSLTYYSYDSQGNPWLSGGGSLRDWEVLKRLASHAEVTLVVGRYPGFKPGTHEGVNIVGIGFGKSDGLCRLTYALVANFCVLLDRVGIIGISPSIYAPVLTWWFHRRRSYLVLHHYIGKQSFRKLGFFGAFPFLYEQLMLRLGLTYFVSNRAVQGRIQRMNRGARVELTTNGFDPALLSLESRISTPAFILFVGRFDVYMKGLDLLIPAYLETAASRGIDLVMAGRASEKDTQQIREMIPEIMRSRIRMELNISAARKAELLSSCLFFCSPSRFEGFGIAALEANAAGKAVLATDTDGFRDSLALGETAIAVPPENHDALKTAMIRLMDDKELREKLGAQGRKRACAFGWDAIAEREWRWILGMDGK